MIDLIVSQGRVADREPRMIEGAAYAAKAIAHRYGLTPQYIGTAAPVADDDWSESLPQARQTLADLGSAVSASVTNGDLTVLLANTCSASLATLPVVARELPDAVVLYIDAHGDFNTPDTTATGYLGGMVLSGACGLWDSGHGSGLRPEHAVLVGSRDIDPPEHELLQKTGIRILPPREATAENVMDVVRGAPVWVHIDWDVLEPGYIPADYNVPHGILPAQILEIFAAIPSKQLRGVELAEFNAPTNDTAKEAAAATILDMVAPVFEQAD